MLHEAVKHVIAINAATRGRFYPDLQEKIDTLKNMDEDKLREKLQVLKNILDLVTTVPMLKEPTLEGLEMREYIENIKKEHGSIEKYMEWRKTHGTTEMSNNR